MITNGYTWLIVIFVAALSITTFGLLAHHLWGKNRSAESRLAQQKAATDRAELAISWMETGEVDKLKSNASYVEGHLCVLSFTWISVKTREFKVGTITQNPPPRLVMAYMSSADDHILGNIGVCYVTPQGDIFLFRDPTLSVTSPVELQVHITYGV